jgi:hypothetical protein
MKLIDSVIFLWSLFLLVLGLVFVASGVGVFVVGHADGLVFIVVGTAMFWGGWIISGAQSLSCAAASVLNMIDAASTLSFWNFEVNPLIVAVGPTIFLTAKVVSSLSIMLYAKLAPNPKRGGIIVSALYAGIVGWNMGQHLGAYWGMVDLESGVLLGSIFSFLASALTLYLLFASGKENKAQIGHTQ